MPASVERGDEVVHLLAVALDGALVVLVAHRGAAGAEPAVLVQRQPHGVRAPLGDRRGLGGGRVAGDHVCPSDDMPQPWAQAYSKLLQLTPRGTNSRPLRASTIRLPSTTGCAAPVSTRAARDSGDAHLGIQRPAGQQHDDCRQRDPARVTHGSPPLRLPESYGYRPGGYVGRMSETVFTYAAPALKFGPGASAEVGHDLASYGARRVLLVTDPGVAATGHPARIAEQVAAARHRTVTTYDRRPRRADRRVARRGHRLRPRRRARSTRSSRSAAARRSTPPRRSTCCSPTPAS